MTEAIKLHRSMTDPEKTFQVTVRIDGETYVSGPLTEQQTRDALRALFGGEPSLSLPLERGGKLCLGPAQLRRTVTVVRNLVDPTWPLDEA